MHDAKKRFITAHIISLVSIPRSASKHNGISEQVPDNTKKCLEDSSVISAKICKDLVDRYVVFDALFTLIKSFQF